MSEQDESPVDAARRLLESGRRRPAVELLTAWVADYPDDAKAWATLARALFELENWADAEQAAAEALRLRPNSARHWSNWGMVLRKLGDLDEAERAQYRALALDPTYARARKELRKLHRLRMGDERGPEAPSELERM